MNKLGFLISTCKSYFSNVPRLIREFEASGVDKSRLLVVSAQEAAFEELLLHGVRIVRVPFTGLHLTGLIYLLEHPEQSREFDYWFTTPCTVSIGSDFPHRVEAILHSHPNEDTIPLIRPGLASYRTMDMGIVSNRFIEVMSEYLASIKLDEYSPEDLYSLKKQLIYDENSAVGLPANKPDRATPFKYNGDFRRPTHFMVQDYADIESRVIEMGNGEIVRELAIRSIDLAKYQRNFSGPEATLIMNADGTIPANNKNRLQTLATTARYVLRKIKYGIPGRIKRSRSV